MSQAAVVSHPKGVRTLVFYRIYRIFVLFLSATSENCSHAPRPARICAVFLTVLCRFRRRVAAGSESSGAKQRVPG